MLRTNGIFNMVDGQDLSDEQKAFQLKLNEEFQNKLRQKLRSFDDINNSVRFFNIIHSSLDDKVIDFTYYNKPGFDFFDSKGNWNKNANNIKENTILNCDGLNSNPFYDAMCAKINGVLYPEILHENDRLTDKEKLILSAVVDHIQTEMSHKYSPDASQMKLDDILDATIIDEMIFQATCSSVKNILPELEFLIAIPASFESKDISRDQLHPQPIISVSIFNSKNNKNKSVPKINDDQVGCKCILF